ncbi:protein of unknown function [Nitrospira japonica]|uniref:DUF4384 domain-containing protein n=1 Tax=Nitrospira japonica TaxID=1325564 RepID=A0A1W1I853_9BACT|nr:DUF4384 domain-containing protein [Nitrospira japonica]SLM49180.1 protein of unknown function [Nitrospira japonica]
MTNSQPSLQQSSFRRFELSTLLGFLLLSSCAAAPFLIPAGIEFARNLLMTSNKNYGSKYSEDMNRLMMRLSTPYVAMGLPMGTPQSALIPPAMQQPGMNQMVGQGMPGQPGMDPYAQAGQMQGMQNPGYAQGSYGQQPGMGYGMQGSQFGGQPGAYDPNNPYAYPGTNVQAPAYGMNQAYGGQQYGGQPQYGQMGGGLPQSGYQPQPSLPLQPGYPATAPGATAPAYPPQGNPGYPPQMGQAMPQHQPQLYQQPAMDPYQQQYQQQPMAGMQGYAQPGMTGQGQVYQQPVMDPYQQQYQQQPMAGMQGGYNQQTMPGQPYQQYQQPYQQQPMQNYQQQQLYQQPVAAQPYGYGGQPAGMGYGGQVYPRSVAGPAEPVALDVALVRQVPTPSGKGKHVVMMQDGETLKGGPNGDRFKLIVRTNCECFVYVISIDGSGWAQPVFPLDNGSVANPLKPEVEQAFPEGQYWFTLDQYKGVETFFLVASPARRTDIEESLAHLAGQQRPTGQAAAKVEEPAVIPNGFGKTEAAKATMVKDESQQPVQVTPLSYVATKPGEDVRVTRWFNHQ